MGQTLNKATISKHTICIPSISVQQSIVSELDKINELIRLKKEQLSDYDKLAQSLFNEMFGDPIENEKG
ncbi:MAG: restriction endonuclease subunit S, partial [Ligilactobacillus ruminis]